MTWTKALRLVFGTLLIALATFVLGTLLATVASPQAPRPRPLPERWMTFTMSSQVTEGGSCEGATPMLADSCNAHFLWRGPIVNGWGPIKSAFKIRGRAGQRYWFPMPLAPGKYALQSTTSGPWVGGSSVCMRTDTVVVQRWSSVVTDLEAHQ